MTVNVELLSDSELARVVRANLERALRCSKADPDILGERIGVCPKMMRALTTDSDEPPATMTLLRVISALGLSFDDLLEPSQIAINRLTPYILHADQAALSRLASFVAEDKLDRNV